MWVSAHLLWSSSTNSHSPLNYDGVEYQNRDTENIHASDSCVVRVGKAWYVCGVKDKLDISNLLLQLYFFYFFSFI